MDWLPKESKDKKMEQNSPEWLAWRKQGIGSSDIAVILGVSPWKNVKTLFEEKAGLRTEDFKGNWATDRGSRLEPRVRKMYERKNHAEFPPESMVHRGVSFIRASFDGVNHDLQRILEIKCPGKDAHAKAVAGEVPAYYVPQCQYLLFVSGYDDLDYVSWDGESEEFALVKVKADKSYQTSMINKATEFWGWVQAKRMPEPKEEAVDLGLFKILQEREKIKNEIDALTIGLEQINATIREKYPQDQTCGPYKIKYSEVKGVVDYGAISQLDGVDLEPYRKPPSKRMNITKEKK